MISLNRPMSPEGAVGKNPVSHVGKMYTLLSHHIAQRIYTALDPVEEVYVWLCSQIGQPVAQPWITSAQVALAPGVAFTDVERAITEIIEGELADLPAFVAQVVRGAFPIC